MPPKKQPEPIKRDFQNKFEEARKRVDALTHIYQRLKEKINPSPKIRKIKKTKGDPANLSTWPVVDLKQFMREHNLKGVSKKKSELVETIQKYIS